MASGTRAIVTPAGVVRGDADVLEALLDRRGAAVLAYCELVCVPSLAPEAAAEALARFRAAVAAASSVEQIDPERLLVTLTRHAAAARAPRPKTPLRQTLRRRLALAGTIAGAQRNSPCELVPELLVARAEGTLSAADVERLESHLRRCPECRSAEQRFRAAERAYREAPETAVPPAVARRMLEALRAAAPLLPPTDALAPPATNGSAAHESVAEDELPAPAAAESQPPPDVAAAPAPLPQPDPLPQPEPLPDPEADPHPEPAPYPEPAPDPEQPPQPAYQPPPEPVPPLATAPQPDADPIQEAVATSGRTAPFSLTLEARGQRLPRPARREHHWLPPEGGRYGVLRFAIPAVILVAAALLGLRAAGVFSGSPAARPPSTAASALSNAAPTAVTPPRAITRHRAAHRRHHARRHHHLRSTVASAVPSHATAPATPAPASSTPTLAATSPPAAPTQPTSGPSAPPPSSSAPAPTQASTIGTPQAVPSAGGGSSPPSGYQPSSGATGG